MPAVEHRHVDGFEMLAPPGDFSAIHLAHENDYETYVRVPLLKDAATCVNAIDVGANIGMIALPLAKAISGHLWCFDMSAQNARFLFANLRRNGLDNVTVLPFAAGEELRSDAIRLRRHTTLNSMLQRCDDEALLGDVQITPTAPIDLLFAHGGPKIDLMKIDVDGWDLRVLRGAMKLIDRDRPILYTEYSPAQMRDSGGSEGEYLSRLLERGYRPYLLGPNMPAATVAAQDLEAMRLEFEGRIATVAHLGQTHIDLRWSLDGVHAPPPGI